MRLFFAAIMGATVGEPRRAEDIRIMRLRAPWDEEATPAARSALDEAVARVRARNIVVVDRDMPEELIAADAAHALVQGYEALAALSDQRRRFPRELSRELSDYLNDAAAIGEADYRRGLKLAAAGRRRAALLFSDASAILTFAAADVAPKDLSTTGSPRFNRLWTLLGLPAVSTPGLSRDGLPIGVQLLGAMGGDTRLLAEAEIVQSALRPSRVDA